jgi:hypothetical protein
MNLEYYLFCKARYENINKEIQSIIDDYDYVISENYCDNFDASNIHFLLQQKYSLINVQQKFADLIYKLQYKINESCSHDFQTDMIDISPDKCENITYCTICGAGKITKNK